MAEPATAQTITLTPLLGALRSLLSAHRRAFSQERSFNRMQALLLDRPRFVVGDRSGGRCAGSYGRSVRWMKTNGGCSLPWLPHDLELPVQLTVRKSPAMRWPRGSTGGRPGVRGGRGSGLGRRLHARRGVVAAGGCIRLWSVVPGGSPSSPCHGRSAGLVWVVVTARYTFREGHQGRRGRL